MFFVFKQKTAYEMRIGDWSADVCSSDLLDIAARENAPDVRRVLAGRDEAKEQALRRAALGRAELVLVVCLGRLADGAGDAARLAEALEGQRVALPAQPGLDQGMGDQGQRARLVAGQIGRAHV